MAVRGVLIDLDGSLLVDHTTKPRVGIPEFIAELKKRQLVVGAMTNRPITPSETRLGASGLTLDSLQSAEHTGCKKPGGSLVGRFCQTHKLKPHETLVIGDDQAGVIEALNGYALGFHAAWGGGNSQYGIHITTPQEFLDYVDAFFLKNALWYARRTAVDVIGRKVVFRTLIDANGAGREALRRALLRTLKDRSDSKIGNVSLSEFLMMHMIASAYLEGLLSVDRDEALWQLYPGHRPDSQAPPLIQAAIEGFKLFRSKAAVKQLYGLIRWQPALQSHVARLGADHGRVKFENQMSSVCLASATRVTGKRVIVIDDFHTKGFSLETARNLYYSAGAKSVSLLAFGKYGSHYSTAVPRDGTKIDPYAHKVYQDEHFTFSRDRVVCDPGALTEFTDSLKRVVDSPIATKLLR